MKTVCHKQLEFESLFNKEVTVCFDGGQMTSDGGGLLLREIDKRYNLTHTAANCLRDPRDPNRTRHDTSTLLKQRIFSIALGYEDTNDVDTLRHDPALKVISGKLPEASPGLASQPTLCRFENRVTRKDLRRLSDWLVHLYVKVHPDPRSWIIIDMDATDDPTHGHQQLSMFHGYFDQHMYHPLLLFDGITGFPLGVILRPGNVHASKGAVAILKRVIRKLRKAYPTTSILLRADAGFSIPELYRFCENNRIYYLIGLITNNRLKDKAAGLAAQVQRDFEQTGSKQRSFTSFRYKADSWDRFRRVVAKVEHLEKGLNQRFLVTNLVSAPQTIYDHVYVLRGEVENRIKELKHEIKADRLSCHRFLANQFRLLLHTAAYCLLWLLRQHLHGTELAQAQMGTLRLKLLKIGGRVRQTTRRIWFHLASSYPYQALFAHVHNSLTIDSS
jgi:hypothetical protein